MQSLLLAPAAIRKKRKPPSATVKLVTETYQLASAIPAGVAVFNFIELLKSA